MGFSVSIPSWPQFPQEDMRIDLGDAHIELFHHGHDDPSVRRLRIRYKRFVVTLLPTKGLSVLEATIDNVPLFWDPPLERIKAPDAIDLAKPLLVNGKAVEGSFWIAQFLGGIEMLGLDNWGMQYVDADGKLHILHGNVSNIPVTDTVIEQLDEHTIEIRGMLTIFDPIAVTHDTKDAQWKVQKRVILSTEPLELRLEDTITNVADSLATPDWGYHVQLRPRPGCQFYLPSKEVGERFSNPLPADFRIWNGAKDIHKREERGYIHSGLRATDGVVCGLLEYDDGTGICITFPHAPYTMVWNSCGGANSSEFLLPDNPDKPLIPKPWDGIGPEIGASDLDHGSAEDPAVPKVSLESGQSVTLHITVTPLKQLQVRQLKQSIVSPVDNQAISDIATHVWRTAAYELERLERTVDRKAFIECVQLLAQRQGRVIACGVGTSGVAAKKLVHSLCCLEVPALYLDGGDAVHGALGSVQEGDVVFLISKGGGTREIVQLLPSLKAKKTTIVAITEKADSELGKAADVLLQVAIEKEADTFNMLATTSTLTVIALFDALAIAVMQVTGFTQEQFAIIHPSGAVGERLLHKH